MSDNLSHIKRTSQAIDNLGFDEEYLLPRTTLMTENAAGTAVSTQKQIATEETLQAVLAASGGSVYNYIQSAADATYKYYGFASSTGWKFKRKTLATGVWMVAEGAGSYDTNWTARASKTYSYV